MFNTYEYEYVVPYSRTYNSFTLNEILFIMNEIVEGKTIESISLDTGRAPWLIELIFLNKKEDYENFQIPYEIQFK